MNTQQLEITFDETLKSRPAPPQRRQTRAQWWFAQMRRVVDQALDWKPRPPARPEQIYLTLARGR